MKRKYEQIWKILGIIELIVGIGMYLYAKWEMATNSGYSWKSPYTSYEAKILIIDLIAKVLLIFGVGNLLSAIAYKINGTVFAKNHIKEVDFTMRGVVHKCPRCGIMFLSGTEVCPNCGMALNMQSSTIARKERSRTTVTVAMNTNEINSVIQIVSERLEQAGYKQKIVDGETVWAKGDGAGEVLQCIQIIFTEKSAVIQAWTMGALMKEADLEGFWAKEIKQQMKHVIGGLCQEIRLRNL